MVVKDPTCSVFCSAVVQNSLLISNMTCSPKRGQKRCTPTHPPAKLPTIKSHFLSFVSLPCTPYISATMRRSGRVGRSRATCCHHKLSGFYFVGLYFVGFYFVGGGGAWFLFCRFLFCWMGSWWWWCPTTTTKLATEDGRRHWTSRPGPTRPNDATSPDNT